MTKRYMIIFVLLMVAGNLFADDLTICNQLLKTTKNNNRKAELYFVRAMLTNNINDLKESLRYNQYYVPSLRKLAEAEFNKGNYQKAEQYYQKILKLVKMPDVMVNVGICYIAQGNVKKAKEYILNSTKTYYGLYGLGLYYYYGKKDYEQAVEAYELCLNTIREKAMQVSDEFLFSVYCDLGDCYAYLKNYDKAMENYEVALKFGESNNLFYNMAYISQKQGNINKMLSYMEKIAQKSGDGKIYYNIAVLYANEGNFDKTFEFADKSIRKNPNIIDAYYLRGLGYAWKKEFDKAIKDFYKAVNGNASYKPYVELAEALEKKGNIETAKKVLLSACNDAKASKYKPYFYFHLAKVYTEGNNMDYPQALKYLELAETGLTSQKDKAVALYLKGLLFQDIGLYEQAEDCFKKAKKLQNVK